MTASPAADWLPVINGQRPDFPGDTQVDIRWTDGIEWDDCGQHYALDSLHACWPQRGIYVTHIRLAPAQTAEWNQCPHGVERPDHCALCEAAKGWHPTTILPAEGRVVELRLHKGNFVKTYGRINAGTWDIDQDSHGKHFVPFYGADSDAWEWRYPPGERAEATPACKHDFWPCAEKCKLCGIRLVDLPATINAGAKQGSESTRNQSVDSSARET